MRALGGPPGGGRHAHPAPPALPPVTPPAHAPGAGHKAGGRKDKAGGQYQLLPAHDPLDGGYRVDLSGSENYHHPSMMTRGYAQMALKEEEESLYALPKDARRHHSNDSSNLYYGVDHQQLQQQQQQQQQQCNNRLMQSSDSGSGFSPAFRPPHGYRKNSDQDPLYDSAANYNSRRNNSTSSSTAEVHQYTSLNECNNNINNNNNMRNSGNSASASPITYMGVPVYGGYSGGGGRASHNPAYAPTKPGAPVPHSPIYSKPGSAFQPNTSWVSGDSSGNPACPMTSSLPRAGWQGSQADDVFLDTSGGAPEVMTPAGGHASIPRGHPVQGHQGHRHLSQVHPEMASYPEGQVSLV